MQEDITISQPNMEKEFYGWKILILGGAGGLLTAGGLALPEKPVATTAATFSFVLGAPTYALSGPIIHWSRGHFGKGLVSFAGNVAFAMLGGIIGRGVACSGAAPGSDCGAQGFGRGAAVGAVVAPVVDGLVLGWDEVPAESWGRVLMPYVDVGVAGQAVGGLVGRF